MSAQSFHNNRIRPSFAGTVLRQDKQLMKYPRSPIFKSKKDSDYMNTHTPGMVIVIAMFTRFIIDIDKSQNKGNGQR